MQLCLKETLTQVFSSAFAKIINELKEAFFSLKINKGAGYDEVSSNVITNCFSELNYPLKYLLRESIEKVVFPDALKITSYTTF